MSASVATWTAVVSAIGAVVSAVVAAIAAFWSRAAACKANEAAMNAVAIANTMAEVEKQRRHQELMPNFRVRATILDDSVYPGFATLFVMFLDGQLDALDAITIVILNTVDLRPWNLPDSVDEAEAEKIIWSGWEFDTFFVGSRDPRAHLAASRRQSKPRPFSRREGKDWYQLLIRRTRPPEWDGRTEEEWRSQYDEVPIRLALECVLAGHEPWTVYKNVTVEPCPPGHDGRHLETAATESSPTVHDVQASRLGPSPSR
jgi:hypothetical protein